MKVSKHTCAYFESLSFVALGKEIQRMKDRREIMHRIIAGDYVVSSGSELQWKAVSFAVDYTIKITLATEVLYSKLRTMGKRRREFKRELFAYNYGESPSGTLKKELGIK